MKSKNYKIFAWVATALFVLLSGKLFYDFYTLDARIVEELGIIEIAKKRVLANTILIPFVAFGLAFFMAVLAILLTNIAGSTRYAEGMVIGEVKNDQNTEKRGQTEAQSTGKGMSLSALGEVNKVLSEYSGEERLERILSLICKNLEAAQGAVFLLRKEGRKKFFNFQVGYAYYLAESQKLEYEEGEGLVGQVGKDGVPILLKNVPEGYMKVISGLGEASPRSLLIVPIFARNGREVIGIFELASFSTFTELQKSYVQQVASLLTEQMEESLIITA